MSVRLAQTAIPRSSLPAQAPRPEPKREEAKSGSSKPSSSPGSSAKGVAAGSSRGAQGAGRQEGAESGGQLGANTGGFDSVPETHEAQGRNRLTVIQGEGSRSGFQGQQAAAHPAPQQAPALERSRGQALEVREEARARQEILEGRARLRAVVMERVQEVLEDAVERLSGFLKAPGRLGVVNLSLVLSESSLTYELWEGPSTEPERRARMASLLGVAPGATDAQLLGTLMGEVHAAFEAFEASPTGRQSLQRYEEVLKGYEEAEVLPVVPGHDTGPMLTELARVGLVHEADFSRSMLVHPLLVAVGLTPEEGSETQVMIAGLSVAQLGALVAEVRRLNPRLSNQQVCKLLLRATTTKVKKKAVRKSFGEAELERVLEAASQLLRMQVFELFFV